MKTCQMTISLQSAFASPIKGDTLFGQLCWAIRNRLGEAYLDQCLEGYAKGQPFAVISDALPVGYLPLPKLPSKLYRLPEGSEQDRKAIKKRNWLAETEVQTPLNEWLCKAVTAAEIISQVKQPIGVSASAQIIRNELSEKRSQPHNTINRQTNTTGEAEFAPYGVDQEWFESALRWKIVIQLDTERLSLDDCRQCLDDIGNIGYGRDASIGMGKYNIEDFQASPLPAQLDANACLTLAPCAPQGLGYDSEHSYYQLFTRFGRHGDIAVHREGKPFKNPLLLAQSAAVFSTPPPKHGFIGQGIGGNGKLSNTLPATVHQGYAPVIAINFNARACQ